MYVNILYVKHHKLLKRVPLKSAKRALAIRVWSLETIMILTCWVISIIINKATMSKCGNVHVREFSNRIFLKPRSRQSRPFHAVMTRCASISVTLSLRQSATPWMAFQRKIVQNYSPSLPYLTDYCVSLLSMVGFSPYLWMWLFGPAIKKKCVKQHLKQPFFVFVCFFWAYICLKCWF